MIKNIGNLHITIYNRGTNGNTYELNMYHDSILEHVITETVKNVHIDSINKSKTKLFDRILLFKFKEINEGALTDNEKEIIPILSRLNENVLQQFSKYDYTNEIDKLSDMVFKSNSPVEWESFRSSIIRSEFFKKEFKPFLMRQGLNDYQIERYVENLLRVKHQHYTNYYLGNCGLAYM